ncbi:major facilitator superfamily domain-containing protein [Cladochytrium replicatum]|nr:major facilitator superfamily domain-containing protein [Cladochytrium replicatum]
MVQIGAFWFSYHLFGFLLTVVIVPAQVERIVGDENKGTGLSLATVWAGIVSLFLGIVLGKWNDRFTSPYGRRRPWILAGTLLTCLSTLLLRPPFALYAIGYVILQSSMLVASVPFNGLVADITSASPNPSVASSAFSAILGALNLAAYLAGALLGIATDGLGFSGTFAVISGIHVVGTLVTTFSADEERLGKPTLGYERIEDQEDERDDIGQDQARVEIESGETDVQHNLEPGGYSQVSSSRASPFPPRPTPRQSEDPHQQPRPNSNRNRFQQFYAFWQDNLRPLVQHRNFRLVFISRLLFQLGVFTVQQFLQYWVADCVDTKLPSTQAVSLALLPLLIVSPIGAAAVARGKFAQRRKPIIYASASAMALACVLMLGTTTFTGALAASTIFGIGYGPFLSVEFALLMDVLPDAQNAARDISLWHTALVLPQVLATPVIGWARDFFQMLGDPAHLDIHCLGYKVVYSTCLGYFIAGAWVTFLIFGVE